MTYFGVLLRFIGIPIIVLMMVLVFIQIIRWQCLPMNSMTHALHQFGSFLMGWALAFCLRDTAGEKWLARL